MKSEIKIQDATIEDAQGVAELVTQLGYPVSKNDAAKRIAQISTTGYRLIIAKSKNDILGVIELHWYHVLHMPAPEGRIVSFCVDEKVRGSGVGTELLSVSEKFFDEIGCSRIVLNSNLKRTETHQYYLNRGYAFTSKHFVKYISK